MVVEVAVRRQNSALQVDFADARRTRRGQWRRTGVLERAWRIGYQARGMFDPRLDVSDGAERRWN